MKEAAAFKEGYPQMDSKRCFFLMCVCFYVFRIFSSPDISGLQSCYCYSPPPTDVPGKSVGDVDKLASRFCSFTIGSRRAR